MIRTTLAAALACAALAPVAHGQELTEAESNEAHCIVLQIPQGDINAEIVLAYLGDGTVDMTDAAVQALTTADKDCTAQYMWDAEAQSVAMTLSLGYMAAEWLTGAADEAGVSHALIANLQGVVSGLDGEEQTNLYLRKWQDDPVLEAKVKRLLLAQGAPNDDGKIFILTQLIENSLVYSTQLERFVALRFP